MEYLIIFILVVLSAYFSGSEISYNSANKLRLKRSAESGSRPAALALRIADKFDYSLSAILIGNNLANIAASSVSTVIVVDLLRLCGISDTTYAALISTVVMTLIILIFGEIVPKLAAKQNADSFASLLAYPTLILTIIFFPVTIIVMGIIKLLSLAWKEEESDSITEEELSTIIDTVEEEGVIDENKSELLQSTLDFSDTTVEEILTPRIDMVYIDIDDDDETNERIINESNFSRIPVFEDNIDNIIGVLYVNHYFKEKLNVKDGSGKVDIRSLLMKPYFLHKTAKLPMALADMREKKVHLAVVIDEYGGTMGIVTLEDILEQIVGDIWDETDEIVSDYVKTGENSYDVNGDMSIYDFFELVDISDDDFKSDYVTVGGWAIEMLDAAPKVGDSFSYKNLYVIVTEMDDMRITKLSVVIRPDDKEAEEE